VFSPFALGCKRLRNRLVALPAGTSMVEQGLPTERDREHVERLAAGGVAMIVSRRHDRASDVVDAQPKAR
jgi:2,4-dienoyl-CoA reductase (NADPH2)